MKVSIVTKVRIGFSGAIFVILVVAEVIASAGIDIHQRGGATLCLALGLGGLLIWATGGFGKAKPVHRTMDREAPAGQPDQEDPLAPFRSRRYWGIMLILSAATLAIASAYRYAEPKQTLAIPVAPPAPAPPPPAAKVTFPPLKLEGLIVHGTQSSALINGQVVLVGEGIGNVRVRLVAVDSEHATVELDGQTNVLSLSK